MNGLYLKLETSNIDLRVHNLHIVFKITNYDIAITFAEQFTEVSTYLTLKHFYNFTKLFIFHAC